MGIFVKGDPDKKSRGDCACRREPLPARTSEAEETARFSCACFGRSCRSWTGNSRCWRGCCPGEDLCFFRGLQGNLVRHFEMSEDGLAICAADDMFFQGIQLFGKK